MWKIDRDNWRMWFRETKSSHHSSRPKRYLWNSVLATIGYILSPLSWWNDMVINIPLAYAFSFPFTLLSERLFMPAFILGYWLTNLLGFVLMHKGIVGIASKQPRKIHWRRHIIIALVYTVIIVAMVALGWIPLPTELMDNLK